jgi:hypothetical protein
MRPQARVDLRLEARELFRQETARLARYAHMDDIGVGNGARLAVIVANGHAVRVLIIDDDGQLLRHQCLPRCWQRHATQDGQGRAQGHGSRRKIKNRQRNFRADYSRSSGGGARVRRHPL